jgi:nicotinamidase-related amidase
MPENAALLVMDVQRLIVERFGDDGEYLARVGEAINAARSAQIPVIYVVVGFRPGFPEISSRNLGFSATKQSGALGDRGDGRMDVHPAIAAQTADLDFQLTVLEDACLDGDPEVHRVLTEKVFPRQAAVTSVQEWAKAIAG